ncbi:MAG: hypothetical protein QM617_11975, partial [Comamonas sp.]
ANGPPPFFDWRQDRLPAALLQARGHADWSSLNGTARAVGGGLRSPERQARVEALAQVLA